MFVCQKVKDTSVFACLLTLQNLERLVDISPFGESQGTTQRRHGTGFRHLLRQHTRQRLPQRAFSCLLDHSSWNLTLCVTTRVSRWTR